MDQNIFEEIIDKMMADELADKHGFNEEFRQKLFNLPTDKKRLVILSLLDEDRMLFTKIKALTNKNINRMDHIKDVILMLREYVKVGEVEKKKFGEVMTPLELVKEMLQTLPDEVWSNPDLKWLDPANGTGPFPAMVIYKLMEGLKEWEPDDSKRYKHIIENMIYVAELQPKNMFLWLCVADPFDEYLTNIYTSSFLEDGFDKHMKDVWGVEKFDIIMGNPPYNKNIDLNFLSKSYEISNKILFVHPSTWILDKKMTYKKYVDIRKLIENNLKKIILFNGNEIFNIGLFVPCMITYIDMDYKGSITAIDKINDIKIEYDNIFDVNKYSNLYEFNSIINKINNKNYDNLHNVWKNTKPQKYNISFTAIRGHVNLKGIKMHDDDFYSIISKNNKVNIVDDENYNKYFINFNFDNLNESLNFLNYIKTRFASFCLSIFKNNQHMESGELKNIPWLDFSQEWTDEKLYKHFNITEEEIKFIEKHIPKYY